MAVLERFVFLDNTSTTDTSNNLSISNAEQVVVEVSGGTNVSLEFQGQVDFDANNFTKLSAINMEKLSVDETITNNGIYTIPTVGIHYLRCVNNGTVGDVKVYGKAVL